MSRLFKFFIPIILSGCATPSQMYWDHKINQLCSNESEVKIYEKVALSKEEYESLPKISGFVTVLIKEAVNENQGYYSEDKTTTLNESNPYVRRVDVFIKRKSDNKTLATYSTFHRVGGDLISMHPSHYACPDSIKISEDVSKVFYIRENQE